MSESIGILSIKGGVGKTTSTIALGHALSQLGKQILVVDENFSAPNLALQLGIVTRFGIYDVLEEKINALTAIVETDFGFDLLPGKLSANKVYYPNYLKLKEKIKHLKYHYDIILIDSSPTLDHETLAAMMASDKMLLVTTPDHVTLGCTLHAINVAKNKNVKIVGLILNKVYNKKFELSLNEIEQASKTPVLAVIPHEPSVMKALSELKPVTQTKNDASIEYKKLAAFLIGQEYKDKRLKTKKKKLFSRKIKSQEVNRQKPAK